MNRFMAGSRKFTINELSRDDLISANRSTEQVTGITFMTEVRDEEALKILKD